MIQHPFRSIVLVLLLAWTACGWLQAGFAYVYDIVYLDTMGRTSGQAYRINNSNQVIGWAGGGELPHASVFWDLNDLIGDGVTHIIDDVFLEPACYPYVYGLSENGLIVGSYWESKYPSARPFIYSAHTRAWVDLGTLRDEDDDDPHQGETGLYYNGFALAVNSSGVVIGVSDPEELDESNWRLTSWMAPDDHRMISTEPVYIVNHPFDINESDQFAGYLQDKPIRGNAASFGFLPTPGGYTNFGEALGINNAGDIVGFARNLSLPDGDRPVLWEVGRPPAVLETYNTFGVAFSINNHAEIVGTMAGGAALWTWDGVHYQPIDLSRYVRPFGVTIVVAFDINDNGWIAGYARYHTEGVERPVVLIPRIDEEAPSASFPSGQRPAAGNAAFEFTVRYEDNGLIDESTLDDTDIRVSGPSGYSERADLVEVGEARYNGEDNRWYWDVTYRIPAPGGLWDDDDVGDYSVEMEAEEVADGADYYIPAGEFGTFTFDAQIMDTRMEKGVDYQGDEKAGAQRFALTMDAAILRQLLLPVVDAWFETPTGAEYDLVHLGNDFWAYATPSGAGVSDFSDGEYWLYLDFGSGSPAEKDMWFGVPDSAQPLPQPTGVPEFVRPGHLAVDVPLGADVAWTAPTDPLVNSIRLQVVDAASGATVCDELFADSQTTRWPYAPLLASHTYRATLSFRHGYYNQMDDAWSFSGSKYTGRTIEFTMAHPVPGTYLVGDLNGDGKAVTPVDLVILQNYLVGNVVHGERPFTEPLLSGDLGGDSLVQAVDLLQMADRMAENN